jgi:hypothetical protein
MEDADDPHTTCQRTSASTISNHVASNNRKELQHQGYHFLDNATNGLDCGTNKHGINGCTLGEVLHQLQKFWISVTLDKFYKVVLTKKPKEFLDVLAGQISGLLSHQSDRDYPQIKFPRPLSTLLQLQGHETLGVLLLLVVSLHSKVCWAKDSPDSNSFGRSKFVNPKDIESFCHLFEVLLVYKTWFWFDAVKKSTIVCGTQVSNATKYTMTRYVNTIDHTQGHGLKTTKTHAPLHMDYNLCNFGSNINSHLGPCELNHIENVKKPSRNTQRQKDTINNQLCTKLSEKMVLDIATGLVNDTNARQYLNPESNDFSSSATRFAIDVANKASEGVGQGKTLTLSLC